MEKKRVLGTAFVLHCLLICVTLTGSLPNIASFNSLVLNEYQFMFINWLFMLH